MIRTFTSYDVIRYYYGEVSGYEKAEIENILANNSDLQKFYCELLECDQNVKSTYVKPSKKSIDNILLYSKNFGMTN